TKSAKVRGAATIAVTDIAEHRLAAATRSGATMALDARDGLPAGLDFEAFIDCSGAPAAISAGIRALRPAGRTVLVGMGPDELVIPFAFMQRRGVTVVGGLRFAPTRPPAVALPPPGAGSPPAPVTHPLPP